MEIELRKRERIIVTCTASGYEKFNIHGNRDIVESDAISTT